VLWAGSGHCAGHGQTSVRSTNPVALRVRGTCSAVIAHMTELCCAVLEHVTGGAKSTFYRSPNPFKTDRSEPPPGMSKDHRATRQS
jgi:hypothetical protein